MFLLDPSIFFWDLSILLLLTFQGAGAIGCALWLKKKKRWFIVRMLVYPLCFLATAGVLILGYASFVEPNILVIERAEVSLPILEPLKIAVIGDTHVGPYKSRLFMERVVDRTNELLPDMVLLTGDYIYDPSSRISDLSPLSQLRAPLGVFAVLGNHDQGRYRGPFGEPTILEDKGEEITATLEARGVRVLRNESEIIQLTNDALAVAGIDDLWSQKSNLSGALSTVPKGMPTILLSHNPSIVLDPVAASHVNLVVSGHTHGGQIRLPFHGPLPSLPTELGQEFDQGVFTIDGDTELAITRGVGESGPRPRLLAWPQILLLEVVPQ